jgi:poly(hydroxyalkanoate) granule-associated protein
MADNNGVSPFTDNQLARLVRESAHQVWQVSRGAYSRAGSGSSRLVDGLLNFGGQIDREAKSRVFEIRTSATEAWDRLEGAFVHRVARALNALQIPTARDVHELNRRVAALQKAVVALERQVAQSPRKKGAPAPRAKVATRRKAAARSGKPAPARPRTKAGSLS